jgi:hypothetical protein
MRPAARIMPPMKEAASNFWPLDFSSPPCVLVVDSGTVVGPAGVVPVGVVTVGEVPVVAVTVVVVSVGVVPVAGLTVVLLAHVSISSAPQLTFVHEPLVLLFVLLTQKKHGSGVATQQSV